MAASGNGADPEDPARTDGGTDDERRRPPARGRDARPRLTDVLRDRGPEILLEAASVVFAVLLALGVNEWRQSRADADLAATARRMVIEEVRANRAEVTRALDAHRALAASILGTVERLRAAEAEPSGDAGIDLSFSLAETSAAAWETARATEATRHLDFEWVSRAARAYNLQDVHAQVQTRFLDAMASIGEMADEGPPTRWLRTLAGRLDVIVEIEQALLEAQDELLAGEGDRPG